MALDRLKKKLTEVTDRAILIHAQWTMRQR